MANCDLTPERVRSLYDYDPETGNLVSKRTGRPIGFLNDWGYLVTNVSGKQYRVHRLAWLHHHGAWPTGEIDHINGVKTDNRLSNLRDVPPSYNQQNRTKPQRNNILGILGVSRQGKGFKAGITINGAYVTLGYYQTAEAAQEAYWDAKRKHHAGYSSASASPT